VVSIINAVAILAFALCPDNIMFSFAGEHKIISAKGFLLYISFVGAFILGTFCLRGKKLSPVQLSSGDTKLLRCFGLLFFCLSICGYLLWFGDLAQDPTYVKILFTRGTYATRPLLEEKMIPGFTTLTQFAIAGVTCLSITFFKTRQKKDTIFIVILIGMSLLRMFFFGERLAFIELVVPFFFVKLRFEPWESKKIAFLGLTLFIVAWSTELLRSFFVYSKTYEPAQFLFYRLIMYFSTSLNNFMLIVHSNFPVDLFPITLKALYKQLGYAPESQTLYHYLLETKLNLEYNNKSGWGAIFFEFGYAGIVVSLGLGMLSKLIYNKYKQGVMDGLLFYPLFLLFFYQSYRILFLNDSRIFYPLGGLLLIVLIKPIVLKRKVL